MTKILGEKKDSGKPQPRLIPFRALKPIIEVLMFGADKYQVDNWQHVENAQERYHDAFLRHVFAWSDGEGNDSESGLSHLAHAGCCLLFLLWFEDCKGSIALDLDESEAKKLVDKLKPDFVLENQTNKPTTQKKL